MTDENDSWKAKDLTEILNGTYRPLKPKLLRRRDGIELLYRGAMHSIYGEPESGKSWFFLLAAKQVLTEGGSVACFDFESSAGEVVSRLLLLGVSRDSIRDRFQYVQPEQRPAKATLNVHIANKYDLVGIDGVTQCLATFGHKSREEDDIARWVEEFPRKFSRNGASVLMMDHVVKSNDSRGRFATGSHYKLGAIEGAAFTIQVLEPFGKSRLGKAEIRIAKDRPGGLRQHGGKHRSSDRTQEIATLVLDASKADKLDGYLLGLAGTESADPEGRETSSAELMEKCSEYIEANPGCAKGTIEKTIGGKDRHVRQALETLEKERWIRVDKGSAHRHYSENPFRHRKKAAEMVTMSINGWGALGPSSVLAK